MFFFFFNANNYSEEFLSEYNLKISDLEDLDKASAELKESSGDFVEIIVHCMKYLGLYYKIYSRLPGQSKLAEELYNSQIEPLKNHIRNDIKIINDYLKNMDSGIIAKYSPSLTFETGRAHKIPYIAILNPQFTSSAIVGFYTVLFFDVDLKTIYISLNIGENKHQEGLQDSYRSYLNNNLNSNRFDSITSLDSLKNRVTNKNKHYFNNNIVSTMFTIESIQNNSKLFLTTLKGYLDETDRLLSNYQKSDVDIEIRIDNRVFLQETDVDDYSKYNKAVDCSVEGCGNVAEYAVFLYDNYDYNDNHEFLEQDYTCPFICTEHFEENEINCSGRREYRTALNYMYTNQQYAQGYSRYLPISPEFRLKTLSEKSIEDCMEMNVDIEAFANLLMHEDLELPTTIGIFGDWGSGKTFFTDKLIQFIKENQTDICVAEFNAWNYYDSNITINLVYSIFGEISKKINCNKNEFLKKLDHYKEFIKYDNAENINKIEAELTSLQIEKTNKSKDIVNKVVSEVLLETEQLSEVREIVSKYKSAEQNISDIIEEIDEISNFTKIVKKLFCKKNMHSLIVFSIILFGVIVLLDNLFNINIRWIQKFILQIIGLCLTYSKKIKEILSKVTKNRYYKLIKDNLNTINNEISEIDSQICQLEKRKIEIQELDESQITTQFLRDYISNKLSSEGYKDNIGFISTVKQDIDDLKTIVSKLGKSHQIRKIALVIDDLDRCPEKKVVEVLQAIQLLLSTEMFIVIIAVDSKWINNSIASIYTNMMSITSSEKEKSIFAINYLEKIIHIPFWLKTLSKSNSIDFIEKLRGTTEVALLKTNQSYDSISSNEDESSLNHDMEPEESNSHIRWRDTKISESTENIEISTQDINMMRKMEFLFDRVSPRKIKRFFNTILLIKFKYYKKRSVYSSMVFCAASIVLKPQYACSIYKKICAGNSLAEASHIVDMINEHASREGIDDLERAFFNSFIDYYRDHLSHLNANQFKEIIYESSRYTYYHEAIFEY